MTLKVPKESQMDVADNALQREYLRINELAGDYERFEEPRNPLPDPKPSTRSVREVLEGFTYNGRCGLVFSEFVNRDAVVSSSQEKALKNFFRQTFAVTTRSASEFCSIVAMLNSFRG